MQGLILAGMNSLDQARKTAADLEPICRTAMDPQDALWPEILEGVIAFQKGDRATALERLKQACGRLKRENAWQTDVHAMFFDLLAQAFERSGDLEAARREYEKITALTSGRFRYGDIYARSFYHLGRIHEQHGQKAKAIENYKKFLDLWKEADPGRPEVPDANKRLAALEGKSH